MSPLEAPTADHAYVQWKIADHIRTRGELDPHVLLKDPDTAHHAARVMLHLIVVWPYSLVSGIEQDGLDALVHAMTLVQPGLPGYQLRPRHASRAARTPAGLTIARSAVIVAVAPEDGYDIDVAVAMWRRYGVRATGVAVLFEPSQNARSTTEHILRLPFRAAFTPASGAR